LSNSTPISNIDNGLSSKKVLKLALFFEIPLACPFLVYCWYRDDWSAFSSPSYIQIIYAITLSLLLFLLNMFFYYFTYRYRLRGIISFIEGVVEPLAMSLNPLSALIVSIAAGIGEEFFFRGFLLPNTGLLISSLAFAALHFLFEIRRFFILCVIYALIGIFFGLVYMQTATSIWVVVFFHSLYDFFALLFFRSKFRLKLKNGYQ